MSRIPIRIRLALAFAVVMSLILAGVGLFLRLHVESDLDESIDREIDARLAGVVAIVRDDGDDLGDPERDPLERVDQSGFVQVLEERTGDVAGGTPPALAERPLVSPDRAAAMAASGGGHVDLSPMDLPEDLRVAAARAIDDRVPYLIVVGASLEQRDEALSSLARALLIGGLAGLALSALAGYAVTAAALRPVNSMRLRAAEISERDPGRRLPVPPANDEISALGETLNSMLGRLAGALERERAFIADAGHELRTPVTVLKAQLDLAGREGRTREELVDAIASAGEETDRLARLAEDLLVIARADEGRLALSLDDVRVEELAESARARIEGRRTGARVEVEPTDGVSIRADRMRVEQALVNLVDNAIRHGGSPVRVEFEERDGRVEIHVLDSGPGFADGFERRAFERFNRAPTSREVEGAGLGLAIVAAVARSHGGDYGARNREGGGADVWISLSAT